MTDLRAIHRFLPLLAGLVVASPAAAQERALTQYVLRAWTAEDALPTNNVFAIAEAPDGALWVGTDAGLGRFDGLDFTPIDTLDPGTPVRGDARVAVVDARGRLWAALMSGGVFVREPDGSVREYGRPHGLPSANVTAIVAEDSATTWVTAQAALVRIRGDSVAVFDAAHGLGSSYIGDLAPASRGGLWIGTRGDGFYRFDGTRFVRPAGAEALGDADVRAIAEDSTGTVWIGTPGGVVRWRDGRVERFTTAHGLGADYVWTMLVDRAGTLWVGTSGGGLSRWRDGRFETIGAEEGLPGDDVKALFEAGDGTLWVGFQAGGLAMLRAGDVIPFTTAEGLSATIALALTGSRDGAMWFGTFGGGVTRRGPDGSVRALDTRDGLPDDVVLSLAETPDGFLWIGTRGGLVRYGDGRMRTLGREDGLTHPVIVSLLVDRAGRLWAGTPAGVNLLGGDGIRRITSADGLSHDHVFAIHEARDGSMWFGTDGGGATRMRDGDFEPLTAAGGLPSDVVFTFHEDDRGVLWIGTSAGVARWAEGSVDVISTRHGLPDEEIHAILEDDRGWMWISGNSGVARIPREELDAVAAGRADSVRPIVFGESDGMPDAETNGGFQPSAWRDRSGALWFPTMGGAARIDPAAARTRHPRVRPRVQRVLAEGTRIGEGAGPLAPATEHIEFHYSAVSLHDPEGTEFQYRLDGFETRWTDAGARRVAYYTSLDHGAYEFRVRSRLRNGPWSKVGTGYSFRIRPHFYETGWFYVLVALAIAGTGAAAHRWRVRKLEERTRERLALVEKRARAERRYRTLFENANDVIFTLDVEGRLTAVNRRGEELLGYDRSKLLGSRLERVLAEEDRTLVETWLEAVRDGKPLGAPRKVEFVNRSGEPVSLEVGPRPLYEGGSLKGIQAIARDLRERRALEERLRQAHKMEAVGQLAGGIAHDFNNLLTAIFGYVDLLLGDRELGSDARADAEEIRATAERAAALTRQLLAFGRRQPVRPRRVDLHAVVSDVLGLLRRVVRDDIEVDVRLKAPSSRVLADAVQLEQIVLNLVINAQDAMPEGGRVTVATAAAELDGRQAVGLSVRDTGVGMDAATRERVFEPFFTTKETGKGTGLGLATVYGIVRQCEGRIDVESAPGRGTVMRVTLPVTERDDVVDPAVSVVDAGLEEGDETVLVVEDDPAVRSVVARTLVHLGYEVLEAGSGDEALELWRKRSERVQAVISDIVMPGISGRELARRIREERPDLPVLFLSGYEDPDNSGPTDERRTDLLAKPFDLQEIGVRLRRLLDG